MAIKKQTGAKQTSVKVSFGKRRAGTAIKRNRKRDKK